MSETRHVCGARGFGLHVDDRCPACEASAPREPAAGATPAREETPRFDADAALLVAAIATLERAKENGYPVLYPAEAAALLAALHERDAAREDAARLDWLEAHNAGSGMMPCGLEGGYYVGWSLTSVTGGPPMPLDHFPTLRQVIDAARAAAEGWATDTNKQGG